MNACFKHESIRDIVASNPLSDSMMNFNALIKLIKLKIILMHKNMKATGVREWKWNNGVHQLKGSLHDDEKELFRSELLRMCSAKYGYDST